MMLFREKKKAWWKIIVGFLGGIICLILLMMSWLKMIYILPNIEILSRPIKKLINGIYNKTSFLDPLWKYAPIPNIDNFLSKEFVLFFIISIIFVIFMILMNSGKLQLRKLNKIEQKIQDQILEESIKGNLARSREEIERGVWLPEQSLLASFHALYIAPLIVGIILIFLEKFL